MKVGLTMNNVMRCQADVINNYLMNNDGLAASEFMSDMSMPFDQQDRVLSAISRLNKPSSRKIGLIIELSANHTTNELSQK